MLAAEGGRGHVRSVQEKKKRKKGKKKACEDAGSGHVCEMETPIAACPRNVDGTRTRAKAFC